MSGVALSVIVPTLGRDSLRETFKSLIPQLQRADELIVVMDATAYAKKVSMQLLASKEKYLQDHNIKITLSQGPGNEEGRGYLQREFGMAIATGTHLCFMDDDDIYTDDAFALFREAACDVPVIFSMDDPTHGILWKEPRLEFGNVGTPMFLVPNVEEKLGAWKAHCPTGGGDYTFISQTANNFGEVRWREDVVAIVRPQSELRNSTSST